MAAMSSDGSAFLPGIADGAGLPHSAPIVGAARPGLVISSSATQTDATGALHGTWGSKHEDATRQKILTHWQSLALVVYAGWKGFLWRVGGCRQ